MNLTSPTDSGRLLRPDNPSADTPPQFSTTAVAALIFCALAALLYAGLAWLLWRLPADQGELEALQTQTPRLVQLVVLGAGALLCNLVALILSLAGLAARHESTGLALLAAVISSLLLVSLSGVILAGLCLRM